MNEQKLQAYLFGVKEDELIPFEVEDPFNKPNILKGYLCRRSDHRYGSLIITHINGKENEQIILGTPKQHYPFGRDGEFFFKRLKAKHIRVWEKLDGTNVLAYSYWIGLDPANVFQTYKLRLCPVLRESRFGNFLGMWEEMLEKYPEIKNVCWRNGCNVSFELYGSRNYHTIKYKTPLDTAILFGIEGDAILDPSELDALNIPTAPFYGEISTRKNLKKTYNQIREKTEKKLQKDSEGILSGEEGYVWYLTDTDGVTSQYKCKPETIEQIHWSAGGIGRNIIRATAQNVLETEEEITYEDVVKLLQEEFTEQQINTSAPRIRKVVKELREWYSLQERVIKLYKNIGVSIDEDKTAVMRELSEHFPKQSMKKVYTAIILNK